MSQYTVFLTSVRTGEDWWVQDNRQRTITIDSPQCKVYRASSLAPFTWGPATFLASRWNHRFTQPFLIRLLSLDDPWNFVYSGVHEHSWKMMGQLPWSSSFMHFSKTFLRDNFCMRWRSDTRLRFCREFGYRKTTCGGMITELDAELFYPAKPDGVLERESVDRQILQPHIRISWTSTWGQLAEVGLTLLNDYSLISTKGCW